LPLVFALTLFVSAALLFWVQPMFARLVLPLLGGTPAVWNTCVVFFQAALLAGYGYSHFTPAYLGVRRQTVLHLALMLLPVAVLPVAVPQALGAVPDYVHPALWLLALLLLGVGLPFFAVSTTAPLLQRWFAATGHPAARDPYFLYAASNLGSMIGLLSYPLVLEPFLPLDRQTALWMYIYWALAGLVLVCALLVWAAPARVTPAGAGPEVKEAPPAPTTPAVGGTSATRTAVKKGSPRRKTIPAAVAPPDPEHLTRLGRLVWVLLAFVPSSLMLSVTTYLTTDVAPIPLLWVIPLALYLLTFILAFARRSLIPLPAVDRMLPLVVLVVTVVLLSEATEPVWLLLGVHLLGLFWIALYCHGRLARLRPDPRHLTEFYFWLSLGGVLGGLFNALVAPVVFSAITEYPLVLVLACLLRAVVSGQWLVISKTSALTTDHYPLTTARDVWYAAAVGVLTVVLVLVARSTGVQAGPISVAVMFGLPAIICYTFHARPLRFGLAIGGLLLASSLYPGVYGAVEYRERNFFGVHKVVLVQEAGHKYVRLIHGNTIHGQQSLDPDHRDEPLAYFHRKGPIGRVFRFLEESARPPHDVGVVGLGAGSLAAYARPGQNWTFYDIDPEVIYLARNSGYFTFLRDCRARSLTLVEGDARLRLAQSEDRYDLLVIDAFCSDALPVHLFTREALKKVYLPRLNPKGVLAFHISNRYLDMTPVLAGLAEDAQLLCLVQKDTGDAREGKFASDWVVMGGPASALEELAQGTLPDPVLGARTVGLLGSQLGQGPLLAACVLFTGRPAQGRRWGEWDALRSGPGQPLWRDDYSNIIKLLK
jgi:hypothetical protein